jgi:hypothetical protein
MEYQNGYEQAQNDFRDGWSFMPLTGHTKSFKDGYSDGYHAASGGKMTW